MWPVNYQVYTDIDISQCGCHLFPMDSRCGNPLFRRKLGAKGPGDVLNCDRTTGVSEWIGVVVWVG